MYKILFCLGDVRKNINNTVLVAIVALTGYVQGANAQVVTNVEVDSTSGKVSWMAYGRPWYAVVAKDEYFGEKIPVIGVDVETGNETLINEITNCFYRGSLAYSDGSPVSNTHAYINLCHATLPFTGYVSNAHGVYTIEANGGGTGQLIMQKDDPTAPFVISDESNGGKKPGNGGGNIFTPDTQVARSGSAQSFPNVEVFVEAEFVETYGLSNAIYRIAGTVAFANFIYQQSNVKQMHLTSINVLSGNLNRSGGQGSLRHQLSTLRRSTVQGSSGDVSVLMLGGHVNTTDLLGWAIDTNGCELQIAVAEDDKLNTIDVGRSAAFVVDLVSLTQRGWIFSHEVGHLLGLMQHVNNDPLMDSWFPFLESLSGYVAGCDARSQMFESCEDYDPKTRKPLSFYTCG